MKRTTILAAALAALLAVTGVAAATPGSIGSPDDGHAAAEAADRSPSAGQAGPPAELPAAVPDFVTDVHGAIQQFVDGTLDSLGPAVSERAGTDDETGPTEVDAGARTTDSQTTPRA